MTLVVLFRTLLLLHPGEHTKLCFSQQIVCSNNEYMTEYKNMHRADVFFLRTLLVLRSWKVFVEGVTRKAVIVCSIYFQQTCIHTFYTHCMHSFFSRNQIPYIFSLFASRQSHIYSRRQDSMDFSFHCKKKPKRPTSVTLPLHAPV